MTVYYPTRFNIQEALGSAVILECPSSTAIIEEPERRQFLRLLSQAPPGPLSASAIVELSRQAGLGGFDPLTWLLDLGAVVAVQGPTMPIGYFAVESDDDAVGAMLVQQLASHRHLRILDQPSAEGEQSVLAVIFQRSYHAPAIDAAYAKWSAGNVIFLTAYLRCMTLYIDGLYIASGYTPCHFCHVAWHDVNTQNEISNWDLFQTALSRRFGQRVWTHLSDAELGMCAFLVAQAARRLVVMPAEPVYPSHCLSYKVFDLETGSSSVGAAPLAPACQCLRLREGIDR